MVVFGSREPEKPHAFGFKTHYLGHIENDEKLVSIYSAADVMVVPSVQEAFGQTAAESMACGLPVAAFGHTGLLDIVDHRQNGYLAQPFDTADLAQGIDWILSTGNYAELCQSARTKVVREFDSRLIADKYLAFYKEIVGTSHHQHEAGPD